MAGAVVHQSRFLADFWLPFKCKVAEILLQKFMQEGGMIPANVDMHTISGFGRYFSIT
jgi:hypothetical protein